MEISGRIKLIGGIQNVTATFQKRELVVVIDEQTQYPQPIAIEFTQANCTLLDSLQVGEIVTVSINIRGREWTDPQGNVRYFNSIQGWRITKADAPQNSNSYAQAATAITAPAAAPVFATTTQTTGADDPDDLPF